MIQQNHTTILPLEKGTQNANIILIFFKVDDSIQYQPEIQTIAGLAIIYERNI